MTNVRLTADEITSRLPTYVAELEKLPRQEDGSRRAYGFSEPEDNHTHAIMGTFDKDGNVTYLAAINIPLETQDATAKRFEENGMSRMDMLPAIDMIARERECKEKGLDMGDTIPKVDPEKDMPSR